jgi:hypothetical protein
MAREFTTTTLDELIETLTEARDEWGGDTLVTFASDYGDSHTQQVHRLQGEVSMRRVGPSGYSESGFAIVDHWDDAEGIEEGPLDDDMQLVLVIE